MKLVRNPLWLALVVSCAAFAEQPLVPVAASEAATASVPEATSSMGDSNAAKPPVALAKAKTLDKVTVKGHYSNGIRTSDAASQGAVLGQLLQDIPLLRPAEVLEAIPGLVVTQHSGDGKANQYFLRGYNLDHGTDFATSVDGVPVNMPTNAHGQGYTDLNFLIPEMVDRIDYRKGPYFADNGDFASAGSASIRYRNSLPQGIASLTVGPDDYRRVLVGDSWGVGGTEHGPTLLAAFDGLHENGPWKSPEDMHKAKRCSA